MNRRTLMAAVIAAMLQPGAAYAQSFPSKPIKLIVPFPAGGPADLFARVLGSGMTAELGQQVVIENRAGVGGLAGVDALAKSAPDGYTIGLNGAAALSAIPFMVSKMPFDWQKDLALITVVVRVPEVLVVHPSLGVNTLQELIAYARANPKKINYGSAGTGSITHLAVELLKTEGVTLRFGDDAVDAIAEIASEVNQRTENIGARRLYTVMEKLLDEISFTAPDLAGKEMVVGADYVHARLADVLRNEDLPRYIL